MVDLSGIRFGTTKLGEVIVVIECWRTFHNLGGGIFRLVGCSGVLVPVGIKVRAKTQPNP